MDITRNIKTVEWLRCEMISDVAELHRRISTGRDGGDLAEAAADIILITYILAKRLGVNFSQVDMKLRELLTTNIEAEHELEKNSGDLSALLRYMHNAVRNA